MVWINLIVVQVKVQEEIHGHNTLQVVTITAAEGIAVSLNNSQVNHNITIGIKIIHMKMKCILMHLEIFNTLQKATIT